MDDKNKIKKRKEEKERDDEEQEEEQTGFLTTHTRSFLWPEHHLF